MHSFLKLVAALAIGIGGQISTSVMLSENPALAAKAKKPKQRTEQVGRRSIPRSTGFEHQQCSWENPCPSRNLH
jgi:hypothetical protein